MKKILCFILLTGCSSVPLTKEESLVRILRKSDPEKNCSEVGKIVLNSWEAADEVRKDIELRRKAYSLKGDTVTYDRFDKEWGLTYGTAYKCN